MDTGVQEETSSFLGGLPKVERRAGAAAIINLYHWKGNWLTPETIKGVIAIENQFNPLPSDILLVSFPKTGTTWLKALTSSILRHQDRAQATNIDPLLTHNPHELIPFLEIETFGENPSRDISQIPLPRVFNTHLPHSILPEKVKNSGCRIIYISRNPADTFVSCWHFLNNWFGTTVSLEEALDEFCEGITFGGNFFEHVVEYWKEREKENVLENG